MKARVISAYFDKNTNELQRPGEVIEVTEERFAEINTVGNLLTEFEEPEEAKPKKTAKAGKKKGDK